MDKTIAKKEGVSKIQDIFKRNFSIEIAEAESYLSKINSSPLLQKQKASQLLLRPDVTILSLINGIPRLKDVLNNFSNETLEQAEIQTKYESYIQKEKELVLKMSQLENLSIPKNFDYNKIAALSNEALQKFKKIQPSTLGQASRISGVNPTDIQILMVYMGR